MHIEVAINSLVKEYKHDPKIFLLSRLFGLVFMILIVPGFSIFIPIGKPKIWLDAHPFMNGVVELLTVVFVISSIVIKIDTGRFKKFALIPFGISLLLFGALGWIVVL